MRRQESQACRALVKSTVPAHIRQCACLLPKAVTDPRTPVIVGAAQVTPTGGAEGPIALAAPGASLRLAAKDSGAGERLLRRTDSVRHVATVCWPYSDEAG